MSKLFFSGTCVTSTASISANTPQMHTSGQITFLLHSLIAMSELIMLTDNNAIFSLFTSKLFFSDTCVTSTAPISANTPQTHASAGEITFLLHP